MTTAAPEAPPLASILVVGSNDTSWCVSGWYPVHTGPAGITCRWSAAEGHLNLPVPPGAPARLRLVLSVPVSADMEGVSVKVSAGDRDLLLQPWAFADGEWGMIEASVPAGCRGVTLQLVRNSDVITFVPHKYFGNGDMRSLGLQLAGARLLM